MDKRPRNLREKYEWTCRIVATFPPTCRIVATFPPNFFFASSWMDRMDRTNAEFVPIARMRKNFEGFPALGQG
jgi:hypothetical protein